MTPKLGTVHDFFIMFEQVLRHPPWLYIVWWSQKWKNSVKKKNSGNSIHLHIYAHVLSISKHIHLILCIKLSCFQFTFYCLQCTDASPKHSTLYFGAKIDKKICADHEYLQPLIILIHTCTYSVILVHTYIYSYTLVHTIIQHCLDFALNPRLANCHRFPGRV